MRLKCEDHRLALFQKQPIEGIGEADRGLLGGSPESPDLGGGVENWWRVLYGTRPAGPLGEEGGQPIDR